MLLLLDNYDSFVHNLARYFAEMGCATRVVRSDAVSVAEIAALRPEALVISPGPCGPKEAGISVAAVRELAGKLPILGVCLGHQAIAAAFDGAIVRADEPVHGRTSLVRHAGTGLFENVSDPLVATRYHSLIVDETRLPKCLEITARTEDGVPMALAHRDLPIFGVQFHPESVLTESGPAILANFLALAGCPAEIATAGDFVTSRAADLEPALREPLHW
ncbi:MAG: aminodeoxychorismate/anthranilate synthase component II [Planctomycetaceae bacterium]